MRRYYGKNWRRFRGQILRDRDYTCEGCGRRTLLGLHVHHLTYVRLGAELDSDVIVLCAKCHRRAHVLEPDETLHMDGCLLPGDHDGLCVVPKDWTPSTTTKGGS